MPNRNNSFWDRLIFSPVLPIGLLAVCGFCWWLAPFNIAPGLKLAIPEYFHDINYDELSFADRVSFLIAHKGWDSGPPGEFWYDFALDWHAALSIAFLMIVFTRIQLLARASAGRIRLADYLSRFEMKALLFYPLIWMIFVFTCPAGTDVDPHRIESVIIFAPLFFSMILLVLGFAGNLDVYAPVMLMCCLCIPVCIASPITGAGSLVFFVFMIEIITVIWALVTIKNSLPQILSSYRKDAPIQNRA